MPAGGLVTAGALGLGQTVVGLFNKSKANKEAAKLAATRPKYVESPYYKDALKLAESEVSTGMSGEAKNAYEQGIDRNLSTSLSAIMKSGGTPNNVAEVFDVASQGRQRLAMMKDSLRLNQINNLVKTQELNTQEREEAFQFNQWAPWADAAKANAGARTEAESQIWGGLSSIGSTVMRGAGAAADKKALNAVLQTNGSSPSQSGNGETLPDRATIPTTGPNTANIAPGFISPNIQPLDLTVDSFNLPDIQTW